MRNKYTVIICFLLLALLPYCYTCFYSLPFADDFCFGWTATEKLSFLQKFLKQYLHWNGRYTSDVLVNFHPIITGNLLVGKLILFSSVMLTATTLYFFFKELIEDFKIAFCAALFFLLFNLCYEPNITEGYFWYIGVANYHWGNICVLIQFLLLYKLLLSQRKSLALFTASSVFLILSIGFNEIAALIIPGLYLLGTVIAFRSHKSAYKYFAVHFGIALFASAFVIFSPGNFTRENAFADRFNLPHSVLYATAQTVRFLGTWSLSLPFFVLSTIVIANAQKVKNSFMQQFDYRIIAALILFVVFMGSFPAYFATGILGQHRTINYVFFFFMLLWLWLLLVLSIKFGWYNAFLKLFNPARQYILAILCIVALAFSGNGLHIMQDLSSNRFMDYEKEFMVRQSAIKANPEAPIKPLKTIPNTFKIVDAKTDTVWWVNECMKKFYTETDIVLK